MPFRCLRIVLLGFLAACLAAPGFAADTGLLPHARQRQADLRMDVYVTAQTVQKLAQDPAERDAAMAAIRRMGITKAFVETYRGGLEVSAENLKTVRDFFQHQGLDVAGGIATVPGGNFGVKQVGPLGWLNWQNPKTQRDLRRVVRRAAGIFDTFIIDDFFCTGDVSAESKAAKGDRSWGQYRRDLLSHLAETVFIKPAREVNPDITMIIKYPQWYDRFHLFGYDTVRPPKRFDIVWVGTETRGAQTQRYGYTQPYEGFINYRWLASIAGPKIGGAWFDHGDCADYDFLDQAYMSVMAGAPELVFFNLDQVMEGHPDHARFIKQYDQLADLDVHVRKHPVTGVAAYKPPNSDPGGDMYLMDFIGMVGASLVPVSTFPDNAPVIFLPTQAAADPAVVPHALAAAKAGKRLILTTGFLAAIKDNKEMAALAGIDGNIHLSKMKAGAIEVGGKKVDVPHGLGLPAALKTTTADVLLTAVAGSKPVPFLTHHWTGSADVYVLNTRTYDQADFDAVGEVLLCPRPLGILDLPQSAADTLRQAFNGPLGFTATGPTRVTVQQLDDGEMVVQNFNNVAVNVNLSGAASKDTFDRFAGKAVPVVDGVVTLAIPARSRVWLTPPH